MIKDNLTVSLLQYDPKWEDAPYNLQRLSGMLQGLESDTDLVILPEMFATGFSMNHPGKDSASILSWMKQQAQAMGSTIMGSISTEDNGHCYNRFYWTNPDGTSGYYDKRHLFSMSEEPALFTAGTVKKKVNKSGWSLMPIVCYDLRFPAWCRNDQDHPYDILICIASWPAVRSDAWLTLLKARAIENQCYVIGVNRVGVDGNGIVYQGDSVVFGPKGEITGSLLPGTEEIRSYDLCMDDLTGFRKKFPVLKDMDPFQFI